MSEPVAYLSKSRTTKSVQLTTNKLPSGIYENIPLYTADQLHLRVKMTQKQWNEFNTVRNESATFSDFWTQVFTQGVVRLSIAKLSERDLMTAWCDDENVEIVPDMKWFVRAKKTMSNGKYLYLENTISNHLAPEYHQLKLAYAQQFDAQEEAELWTNPLTEAVQLPVEDE